LLEPCWWDCSTLASDSTGSDPDNDSWLDSGIARLSDNWLVRQLLVYVEIFRNTPLLLQLFFWYFAVFLRLPDIENRITLPGPTYLTGRGRTCPGYKRQMGQECVLLAIEL